MTERQDEERPAGTQRPLQEQTELFRLRPEYPRVTRLSRKVLFAGSSLAVFLVAGATFWALQKNQPRGPGPEELYSTDHHNVAESITALPQDYAKVPRQVPQLGPPLPGDLGRPILSAQGQPAGTAQGWADQERQRENQEAEAARISRLFATLNAREAPNPIGTGQAVDRANVAAPAFNSEEGSGQNAQDRKLAFVNAAVDRRTTSPDRIPL